ncbi:MAG TPA: apolipoprotein N-acyltransferase [Actinomycetota bacterium]|nr:apolipoprotein N-acyltransferase [Actinomycetota bacterium]
MALAAAYPPIDAGPLALVALIPLLAAATRAEPRPAALAGLLFGLVHFGLVTSWLTTQTWLGWGIFTLWQALMAAVALGLISMAWRDARPIRSAFAAAALWATVEWIRGAWPLGGVSWMDLGTSQHDNPLLVPAASWIGSLGLSFVVVAINALLLVAVRRGAPRILPALLAVGLALAPALIPLGAPTGGEVDVAIVQGNVPERLAEEDRLIRDRLVVENHARVSERLVEDPPDLMVWPENALDADPTRDPLLGSRVFDVVTSVGSHAVIGAITTDAEGQRFNENLLYAPNGALVDRYAKNHILPFGEFVPLRRYLSWVPDVARVRDDLTPGEEPGRFAIPGASFATAICFENNFAALIRSFTTERDGFIVLTTNNSSFMRSAAPDQHVALSEMRAVETGRWVVHAALTGRSAFIDHRGRVLESSDLFVPAMLRRAVPQANGRTVYDRIGGAIPWVLLASSVLALVAVRPARRRRPQPLAPDPRVAVVLPTYNEAATVGEAIRRVRAQGVSVIVVDDSSPDGTASVVRDLGDPEVELIERSGKLGLASAYATGFRRALEAGFDLVVEMDADLSHRPEDLPGLLAAAGDHDLVIGSRYIPGGGVRNWGPFRRVLSRAGNVYARLILGLPVRDATSGFRVFRRGLLARLLEDGIRSEGYAFQVELAYRAWRLGYAVGEAPILFEERRAGESKISQAIVVEALWEILRWGVRDRLRRVSGARSARSRGATADGSRAPGG